MKIGELAKRAGCQVVTIRFYEKKGLMFPPERTEANFRSYGQPDLERLEFIRHCRMHGMSLPEIGDLLKMTGQGNGKCGLVHKIINEHITNIDKQIEDLQKLKESLQTLLMNCNGNMRGECEILKNLNSLKNCAYCKNNPDALKAKVPPLAAD